MKSKKLGRMVLRAVLISTLICTINMNIITNKGTFSMFTSGAQGTATIKTADAGDLIKDFRIVEEYGQKFIVIQPGEFLKDDSIVYFEVTGEAAAYITQINPVALSKDKKPMNSSSMKWGSKNLSISKNKQYFISDEREFYIPIYVNVSLRQRLSFYSKDNFEGNVKLRYLNGFIDENKAISFTSKYLNSRWLCGTDYYFWENVKNTLSINTGSIKGRGSSIMASETGARLEVSSGDTTTVNDFQDNFNKSFQNEFKKSFNVALDKEQIEVIDSIADGYRKYVSDLEIKNKKLIKQLEDLQKEKENLIIQIDDLMKNNIGASKESESQIETLKSENKNLQSIIDGLGESINSNTKATINPLVEEKTDNQVTAPAATSETENKVEGSAAISVDDNKVTESAATNDTGNEKHGE